MLGYYVEVALRSLRRTSILTSLMVLAIGLGIGASMTMITVLHVMSGDPLPARSSKLFVPMLDPRPLGHGLSPSDRRTETPNGFTWPDAMNLLHEHHAVRQAAMQGGAVAVHPAQADSHTLFERGEFVTSEFFAMFQSPFRAGSGWTAQQDQRHARVVVLTSQLNQTLFGDASGIGRTVRLDNTDFRVIGVLNDWHPQPRFYGQPGYRTFGNPDQLFLPIQTALELKFSFEGQLSCWSNGGDTRTSDKCTWLQYWVELDSPDEVALYQQYLSNYWHDQQAGGRFTRKKSPPHLIGLTPWLTRWQVIPANLSMQMWLAIGFLFVSILSVVALLLAKFMRRSGEISVRRTLGARRRDIFIQFGVESAVIGSAGGLLGLLIAQFGLWSIRERPDGYAQLAHMHPLMLVSTVVLAIIACVLAGMLPAWRACQVPPALYLRMQ
ncbi:MAG TPA: ABC transporter permease [Steroidobacteraceae bacterium]|jgi:putative ABC transport system permease protein|nr:ABC transporter permease [Steroidobacteraceae bacterium]